MKLGQTLQARLEVLLPEVSVFVGLKANGEEVLEDEDVCELVSSVATVDDLWYWEAENI